jgi:hypothetical protein
MKSRSLSQARCALSPSFSAAGASPSARGVSAWVLRLRRCGLPVLRRPAQPGGSTSVLREVTSASVPAQKPRVLAARQARQLGQEPFFRLHRSDAYAAPVHHEGVLFSCSGSAHCLRGAAGGGCSTSAVWYPSLRSEAPKHMPFPSPSGRHRSRLRPPVANPSIERTASGLRPPAAAHVQR